MEKEIIELYKLEPAGNDSLDWKFPDHPNLFIRTIDIEGRYRLTLFDVKYWATIGAPKELILDKPFFESYLIAELKRIIQKEKHAKENSNNR